MRVGIIADTHNNTRRTETAAAVLLSHEVEAVFHCGDIGTPEILWELVAAAHGRPVPVPIYAVTGNGDPDPSLWRGFPADSGVQFLGRFGEVLCDGKAFALTHGDDPVRLRAALQAGVYRYVLTGHTHRFETRWVNETLLINPGAVHRAAEPSVAVLDTDTDEVTLLPFLDQVLV